VGISKKDGVHIDTIDKPELGFPVSRPKNMLVLNLVT